MSTSPDTLHSDGAYSPTETETILARLDLLTAKVARLESENQALRTDVHGHTRPRADPTIDAERASDASVSRRSLLRRSGTVIAAGAAVAAGQTLLSSSPAAAVGEVIMGTPNNAGAQATGLASTHSVGTFDVTNSSTGRALLASATSGIGLVAISNTGTAVRAEAGGAGQVCVYGVKGSAGTAVQGENVNTLNIDPAVYGLTNGAGPGTLGRNTQNGIGVSGVALGTGSGVYGRSADGIGILAESDSATGLRGIAKGNDQVSVHGLKDVTHIGPAVQGENKNLNNGYAAVYGLTNGIGPAVFGENTQAGNGASGVARGTGSGVYAQSDLGRGGTFVGKKAQLKLVPSTANTHPSSGQAGDIFLDKSKRLWLCKGGSTWVRIV